MQYKSLLIAHYIILYVLLYSDFIYELYYLANSPALDDEVKTVMSNLAVELIMLVTQTDLFYLMNANKNFGWHRLLKKLFRN